MGGQPVYGAPGVTPGQPVYGAPGMAPGQPVYGAPGMGPIAPPPKKKSPLKWILIGILALIVIVAVVIVVALGVLGKGDTDSNTFVSDLTSGNTAGAYAMFSPELQQAQDQATFEAGVATLNLSSSCSMKWIGMSSSTGTNGAQKQSNGVLTCPSQVWTVSLTWLKEGSDYKLIQYSIKQ